MDVIHKAAAVVIRDDSFLMVRKVDKDIWTSLGGHVEAGETPEEAVVREVKEEFDCDSVIIRKLGGFRARAAMDDAELLLSAFLVELKGEINLIDPELEEYRFLGKDWEAQGIKLPDSIKEQVLPYCIREGLLKW